MRSLSFVDFVQFKDVYTGSSRNLCLFDVDRDGDKELILGFWDSGPLMENGEADAEHSLGCLYVIKHRRIWKVNRELGMVLCVTAGNIVRKQEPWIICLCADSHCYAFDATIHVDTQSQTMNTFTVAPHEVKSVSTKERILPLPLKMVHHQQLAYNAKDICLINTDNACDIAVAHSDRVVRLYTWCPAENRAVTTKDDVNHHGAFVILIKWELAGQVNRIDTHWTSKFGMLLIASQPGGGFAVLQRKFEKYKDNIVPTLVYYPPGVANTRNLDARSWLVGNVRGRSTTSTRSAGTGSGGGQSTVDSVRPIVAVCMADGTVLFVDPTVEDAAERVLWCVQLYVRGELFGLSKLNLTSEDTDEVCACAWDGTTYVFNDRKEILRFPMGQSCQAFTAGWYAVEPKRNEPVFVYTTCDHNLLIYYNLNIEQLTERSLFSVLSENESLKSQFRSINIDPNDRVQVQKTVRRLLYGTNKCDDCPHSNFSVQPTDGHSIDSQHT
ncbi:hypothetical protein P879_10149 [Paragonimus westermani]|uniref:Uncharacterized protein n=1 Tax=Paragonimus westermani TaxID=34504 RepID=A0A8T0D3I0_9TREM|nr:hypothetical protein P879_10149 [Paragonimus westermani]